LGAASSEDVEVATRLGLVIVAPDFLQEQVEHLEALGWTLLVVRVQVQGLLGLTPQLDLSQHSYEKLVDVVVDARRGLDVLAAVLDGDRFAG